MLNSNGILMFRYILCTYFFTFFLLYMLCSYTSSTVYISDWFTNIIRSYIYAQTSIQRVIFSLDSNYPFQCLFKRIGTNAFICISEKTLSESTEKTSLRKRHSNSIYNEYRTKIFIFSSAVWNYGLIPDCVHTMCPHLSNK